MIELTAGERRRLRAQAHKLHPVVMVGDRGLTEAVLRAVDAALKSHELIKVKVATDDRMAREQMQTEMCAAVGASPVQHIGKILVLYRENPLTPGAPAPAAAPARAQPARSASKRASPSGPRAKPSRRLGARNR